MLLEISQNSQESTCANASFLIKLQDEAYNFIKKETLAQVFSCEFCEISKNIFSYRTPPVAASKSFSFCFHCVSFSTLIPRCISKLLSFSVAFLHPLMHQNWMTVMAAYLVFKWAQNFKGFYWRNLEFHLLKCYLTNHKNIQALLYLIHDIFHHICC